jgi:uncharacterized metal-binding protein YceD (DUF177 family)
MSRTHKTKKQDDEERLLPPLSRILRVDDIEDGEDYSVEASRSERDAIASLLDLVELEAFRFAGRFHFGGEGRLLLEGTLTARPTQTCVVSLEPVESTIKVPVMIEFWPEARIDALARTADEATSHGILDWPESIVEGKIDLGPLLYETLATSLDPYPRREGASFEWREAPEGAEARERADSPFAALSKLKEG